MKKVFYLVAAALIAGACSQQKPLEARRTVIAGVVEHFSDNNANVMVNYCDPLSDESRFTQDLRQSDGSFHTEHDYVFAQNITIRFAERFINLFVNPGDSVFVTIDASCMADDPASAVSFSGDNAQSNHELYGWTLYSFEQPSAKLDLTAPQEELLAALKRNFDAARDSIDAYAARTGMSDFVKQWALKDHKFIVTNQLWDYNNPQADKWAVFTDPIFDVFNVNNFQTIYFPPHLSLCAAALMEGDEQVERLISENRMIPAVRILKEKLFERAPEGTVRDMMLFETVKYVMEQIPELYDSIPELRMAFSQPLFAEKLAAIAADRAPAQPTTAGVTGEVFFLNDRQLRQLPEVNLLDYLRGKYEGKVLYIDVWATWCSPCIEQFQFAKTLHSHFAGKQMLFVNLCLSSDLEAWQPAITKHGIEGENYFLGANIHGRL